jgi:hypothetical protein
MSDWTLMLLLIVVFLLAFTCGMLVMFISIERIVLYFYAKAEDNLIKASLAGVLKTIFGRDVL